MWLLTGLGGCLVSGAETAPPSEQPTPPVAPPTYRPLSGTSPSNRAAWQQHLTLGPGDLLNLALLNMENTAQREVPIGPDGRITFLQARDIMAAGLTIDELRGKLDGALSKYYQNPRTIVTPAAFHSKRYFMLGAVANKGVYTLDRPLTVIEALARAGGLETGLYDAKTVELADLSRSFLVRNGQRLPVDFEELFQRGNLSQNVPLEPDDYLYFASADANLIYVMGEVTIPGVVAFRPQTTVVGAISARGGFTTLAYQSRVLVVRGSINHPNGIVVDTAAILKGKERDFKLQSGDIVYVSGNPFIKAEDLLNTAARAFIQGFIVQWTTMHIGPIITHGLPQ